MLAQTTSVPLPAHVSLTYVSDCLRESKQHVWSRALKESWPQITSNLEPCFPFTKLPGEVQWAVKQRIDRAHSARAIKRATELSEDDICRIQCLQALMEQLVYFLNSQQCSTLTKHVEFPSLYQLRVFEAFVDQFNLRELPGLSTPMYQRIGHFCAEQLWHWYTHWTEFGIAGLMSDYVAEDESQKLRINVQLKMRLMSLFSINPLVSADDALSLLNGLFPSVSVTDYIDVASTLQGWLSSPRTEHFDSDDVWVLEVRAANITTRGRDDALLCEQLMLWSRDEMLRCSLANVSDVHVSGIIRQGLLNWYKPKKILVQSTLCVTETLCNVLQAFGIQVEEVDLMDIDRNALLKDIDQPACKYRDLTFGIDQVKGSEKQKPLSPVSMLRLLDGLLPAIAENGGCCTVTELGVYCGEYVYTMPGIEFFSGKTVFCRFDPLDTTRLYLFSCLSQQFIGVLYRHIEAQDTTPFITTAEQSSELVLMEFN